MSLLLSSAAIRVYDALKRRPGARPRDSDARDSRLLQAISVRIEEMIGTYRMTASEERGNTYVFWYELARLIENGAFDDLLDQL